MEITVNIENRMLELYLKGELDHHGAKGLLVRLEREIALSVPNSLVLDFADVTFMDSAGIAVAVRGWQRMREAGGSVILRHVAPQPKKVFEAAGIGRLMNIE